MAGVAHRTAVPRAGGRRHIVALGVGVVATLAVLWPEVATHQGWSLQRIYYGLDTRASGLGVGALLGALATLGLLPAGRVWTILRRVAAGVGGVTLIALIHDPTYADRLATKAGVNAAYGQSAVFAIIGIATTLVIWELIVAAPHLGHRLLSWPPLVAIGRISYGLYLWDAAVVTWVNPTKGRGWPLVALHLALTFAAATASWFLIERRFRARKPGPTPSGSLTPGG